MKLKNLGRGLLLSAIFSILLTVNIFADLKISTCNHNETGGVIGGMVGDQTGYEYNIKKFYDGGWDICLRYEGKNAEVARNMASKLASVFAVNDLCGYDTTNREGLIKALVEAKYDPNGIKKCEATCSSSTNAVWITVGHYLGIKKLTTMNPRMMTSRMMQMYTKHGFTLYRGKDYLNGKKNLPGDVLVNIGVHTVVVVDPKDVKKAKKGKITKEKLLALAGVNEVYISLPLIMVDELS